MLSFLKRKVEKLEVCSQALSFKLTALVKMFEFPLAAFFTHGVVRMASSLVPCRL